MLSVNRSLNFDSSTVSQSPPVLSIFFLGRSPFGQSRKQFFSHPDLQLQSNDMKRIDFEDLPSDLTEQHSRLRNQLEGHLHANCGWFSQPLDFSAYLIQHNEQIFLSTDSSLPIQNKKQRIHVVLTELADKALHINATVSLRCAQHFVTTHVLSTEQRQILDKLIIGPNLGKDPLVTITFASRYVASQAESIYEDACDIRKRLFSYALKEHIDDILLFSYIVLHEACNNIEKQWDDCLAQACVSHPECDQVIFEANRVDFTSNYLQYAPVTRQQIQKMIACELKLLSYLEARLCAQPSLFEKKANKIGLMVTLLRYFTHLPIQSEKTYLMIITLENALKKGDEVDFANLRAFTQELIQAYQSQAKEVQDYFVKMTAYSSIAVWENIKLILRATGLTSQLAVYAHRFSGNETLKNIWQAYNSDLTPSGAKEDFLNFQNRKYAISNTCIDVIMLPVKKLYENCKRLGLNDLNSFVDYSADNFLKLIQEIYTYAYQFQIINLITELLSAFKTLFPNKIHFIKRIGSVLDNVKNHHEQQLVSIEEGLRGEIKQVLLPYELYQLVAYLKETRCRLSGKQIDLYIADFLMGTLRKKSLALPLYQNNDDVYQEIDNIYHACHMARNFYTVFDKMMDQYLENIRATTDGQMRSVFYNEALMLRHFMLILHIDKEQNEVTRDAENRCTIFYNRWGEDSIWADGFLSVEGMGAQVAKIILDVSRYINFYGHNHAEEVDGIERLDKILESDVLSNLNPKGRAILNVCAWAALLVYKDRLNPAIIFEKITVELAHLQDEFPIIVTACKKFIELERIRAQASSELEDVFAPNEGHIKKSPIKLAYSPVKKIIKLPIAYYSPIRGAAELSSNAIFSPGKSPLVSNEVPQKSELRFLRDLGGLLFNGNKNSMALSFFQDLPISLCVTLWRYVAERLFYAFSQKLQRRCFLVREQHAFIWQRLSMTEILCMLACLEVSATSPQSAQAFEVLECLRGIFSSPMLTEALLKKMKKRLEIDPRELFAVAVIRSIFFSDKLRHLLFEETLLQTSAPQIEHSVLVLHEVLEKMKARLLRKKYSIFFPYLLKPLMSIFIVILEYFIQSSSRSPSLIETWQENVEDILLFGEMSDDEFFKENCQYFYQAWKMIAKNVAANRIERKAYDVVSAYCVYVKLNLISAMEKANKLWCAMGGQSLNVEIAKNLCFVLNPAYCQPETHLSQLSQFFTIIRPRLRAAFSPIKQMFCIEKVLCISVTPSYTIGARIKQVFLDVYTEYLKACQQNIELLSPTDHSMVLFSYRATHFRLSREMIITCYVEVYEKSGKIVCDDRQDKGRDGIVKSEELLSWLKREEAFQEEAQVIGENSY